MALDFPDFLFRQPNQKGLAKGELSSAARVRQGAETGVSAPMVTPEKQGPQETNGIALWWPRTSDAKYATGLYMICLTVRKHIK